MGVQVEVKSPKGENVGTVELPSQLFAAEVSEYAVYRAVVAYETNQRQGNASTKTRAQISRTGKKHHRQKGTGMARRGSMRSPIVKGGGVAFGPHPRDYEVKLPKTLRRRALCSALSLKGQGGQVRVLDDFDMPQPSTKTFAQVLSAVGLRGQKVLLVTPDHAPVVYKSCRNIPRVQVRAVAGLCTHDIVWANVVLFTRQALDRLAEVYGARENQG